MASPSAVYILDGKGKVSQRTYSPHSSRGAERAALKAEHHSPTEPSSLSDRRVSSGIRPPSRPHPRVALFAFTGHNRVPSYIN